MNDYKTNLLCAFFNCGSLDIELLEDCKFDYEDVLSRACDMDCSNLSINDFFAAMFEMGFEVIRDGIAAELKDIKESDDYGDETVREELNQLNPEEDFSFFCNCLDTHVFAENLEIYQAYFQHLLDEFCDYTGFEIRQA